MSSVTYLPNSHTRFIDRADAHIKLSNEQCRDADPSKVSASMLYAAARFNASISAHWCSSQVQMQASKKQTINYFVTQYRIALTEHLDDYIRNYASYTKPPIGPP
jgi:hypothetical protein